MPQVKARLIFEMMGRPPKHLKEQLNTHVIKMGSEKGIKFINKVFHKPKFMKDANKLYHAFSEIEAEFDSFEDMFNIIFNYMPANIEIFEPEKFKMQSNEINTLSNYILARLHQYDSITKILISDRQKLMDKLGLKEKKKNITVKKPRRDTKA